MTDFEDFVPELEGLLPLLSNFDLSRPDREERVLALAVAGTGVERRSWQDDVEIGPTLWAELRNRKPLEPDLEAKEPRSVALLHPSSAGALPSRCSNCWYDVGKELCTLCGGSGRVSSSDGELRACSCDGGKLTCGSCDGNGKSYKVRVQYFEDRVKPFAHVFAPEIDARFRASVQKFLQTRHQLPDLFAFSLDHELDTEDAYRGRRTAGLYKGHRLGRAAEQAKGYLERLRRLPSVAAISQRSWVWPLLQLRWASGYVAVAVCDEDGQARLL